MEKEIGGILYKFSEGDFVRMIIDSSKTKYMVIGTSFSNGGKRYSIFNGENVLERAEYELELYPKSGKKVSVGFLNKT